MDKITYFERAVVFRIARGYFAFAAACMVLVAVGGTLLGLRGVLETPLEAPALPPQPPDIEPLSYERVLALLHAEANQPGRIQLDQETTPERTDDSERRALDERLSRAQEELRVLFPDPPYAWVDVVEEFCMDRTSFGCLRTGRRVTRQGVVTTLSGALKGLSRTEAVALLETLVRVLGATPVEKRQELIEPIVRFERQRLAEAAAAVEAHRALVEELLARHQAEARASQERHSEWRTQGFYGVAAGFGGLVAISLFMAFLAMERYLRSFDRAESAR